MNTKAHTSSLIQLEARTLFAGASEASTFEIPENDDSYAAKEYAYFTKLTAEERAEFIEDLRFRSDTSDDYFAQKADYYTQLTSNLAEGDLNLANTGILSSLLSVAVETFNVLGACGAPGAFDFSKTTGEALPGPKLPDFNALYLTALEHAPTKVEAALLAVSGLFTTTVVIGLIAHCTAKQSSPMASAYSSPYSFSSYAAANVVNAGMNSESLQGVVKGIVSNPFGEAELIKNAFQAGASGNVQETFQAVGKLMMHQAYWGD